MRMPRIRSSPEFRPTVLRVTPNSGSDAGGEIVHIRGARFVGPTQVHFGATLAAWSSVDSDDHIIALTPAHAGGAVAVKVTTPAGNHSLANAYTFISSGTAPTVIGIAPAYGPAAGGTLVTIEVDDSTGCTSATVGGVALGGFAIVDATHVQGTTGLHAAGNVDVDVTNAIGTSAPLVGGFRYIAAPVITSLNHEQGQIEGGGQSIIITGTDLNDGLGVAPQVTIGGNTVAATGWGAGFASFTLPAHAAGNVTVSVAHAGGTSGTLAFEYWTPASGTPTGWWRASYGGSPWADASGNARDISEATNPPSVGGAVQGVAPADFDGGNDKLDGVFTLDNIINANGFRCWALFKADSAAADPGAANRYQAPQFATDQVDAYFSFGFTANGVHLSNDANVTNRQVAAATGAWHLAQGSYDGATLGLQVNAAAPSTTAGSNTPSLIRAMRFGASYNATAFFDGQILEMGFKDSAGAIDPTKLLKYCRQRYGLALT